MNLEIKVPDIGDFKNVEIIEVLIKEGDQIKKNDPILTLESDKSSVEVPSPFDGKISSIKVKVGDKVSKGSLIATLSNGDLSKIKDNKSILPETEKIIQEAEKILEFIYPQIPEFDSQPEEYRNQIIQRVKDHMRSKEYFRNRLTFPLLTCFPTQPTSKQRAHDHRFRRCNHIRTFPHAIYWQGPDLGNGCVSGCTAVVYRYCSRIRRAGNRWNYFWNHWRHCGWPAGWITHKRVRSSGWTCRHCAFTNSSAWFL